MHRICQTYPDFKGLFVTSWRPNRLQRSNGILRPEGAYGATPLVTSLLHMEQVSRRPHGAGERGSHDKQNESSRASASRMQSNDSGMASDN